MKTIFTLIVACAAVAAESTCFAQAADTDPKQRARAVRDLGKQGEDAIPQVVPYLADADPNVRVEATKALVEIGGPKTLEGLVRAAGDNDPEVQIRATDGLVNVYLPGYVKTGLSGTISRAGNSVKGKFTDTNDQVIDAFVMVRPEAIAALGKLARGAANFDARANAARAAGVLRGRAAIPDLVEALHSKDDKLMYESLVAIQKIGDPEAAPRVTFLLRDLEEKIQVQALETTGLLRNKDAAPEVRDALNHARTLKVRRAALEALAMIADPADRTLFVNNLKDKDDGVRAAAAEGIGRIRNPADRPAIEMAFNGEHGMSPRLSAAFALVELGQLDTARFGPLRYLVNALNQRSWRGVAIAFVIELARDAQIRQAIYTMLPESTKDEKQEIAMVLARSGDRDSIPVLEGLSRDPDPDVAAEGIRSLRSLRARLP
ncbi:MAG TPA: HEAT repeat domain-containing protein [Bryobacteraceae bacterium]|nr:HEAT repeat domain-containing protein [Bryobacteraceae bacterium]